MKIDSLRLYVNSKIFFKLLSHLEHNNVEKLIKLHHLYLLGGQQGNLFLLIEHLTNFFRQILTTQIS